MSEEWRPVVGWEGLYEVSDHGQVRSLPHARPGRPGVVMHFKGRVLKPTPAASGHLGVRLSRGLELRSFRVHRLVLEAFIGPCPEGKEGCHNNGNPGDNRLENLRWDTRSANTIDKVRHGAHPFANRTACKNGHSFDEENTGRRLNGSRFCRRCKYESKKRAWQHAAAARKANA